MLHNETSSANRGIIQENSEPILPVQPKQVVLVELNECGVDLLKLCASASEFPNIRRLLEMTHSETHTDDEYDSDYLEPWVQWVSIHTGRPATEHQVKHLGDVSNLKFKQIWETLSDNGVSSGVWGIMNGTRGDAANCKFFIADPWTWSAPSYPAEIDGLRSLAVYIAKNYLNLSPLQMIGHGFEYLGALFKYVGIKEMFAASVILAKGTLQFGPKNLVLGAFFEYLSTIAFLNLKQKYNPDVNIVFLNLIAHIQHHYWLSKDGLSRQLKFGFEVIDKLLGKIYQSMDLNSELLLVANGLSQVNTNDDPTWKLYRAADTAKLLEALGLKYQKFETLMTHDAHLWFENEEERNEGIRFLSSVKVDGKPLFFVEPDSENSSKLFYRLVFTDDANESAQVTFDEKSMPFFKHFKEVVTRTGKHCQTGFVFQNKPMLPEKLYNHHLSNWICKYLEIPEPARPTSTART